MNGNITSQILWNKAGLSGLILGLFTALCRLGSQMLGQNPDGSTGTAILVSLIWLVQFGGCIWLMKFFMERLAGQYKEVTNRVSAQYGRRIALCSSFIYSAIMLLDLTMLHPEMVKTQMDLVYQMYGQMLDSNTRTALQKVEDIFPQITFFSTLIYSWLYGVVLSSILAINIPKKDAFTSFMDKNNA